VSKSALVVDDQVGTRRTLQTLLENEGYAVESAGSLSDAKRKVLSKVKRGGYELIVSDYDLGDTIFEKYKMFDGYRFLRWCVDQDVKSKLILHST